MKNFILFCLILITHTSISNAQNSIFDWEWQVGGDSNERGMAVETDSEGNIYCTGEVTDTTYFADTTFVANFADIFIAKFSANGNLLWVKTCGGTGLDRGLDLKIDGDNNAVITGFFSGSAVFGDTTLVSAGMHDLFIAKYNSQGDFQWVVHGSGIDKEEGLCIATDNSNTIYIGGFFESTLNLGLFNLSTGNTEALFLTKLNPGGDVIWAEQTVMGEFGLAATFDMIIDPSGDLLFTGYFHRETTFQDTTLLSYDDSDDIFIAKYNSNGDKIWVRQAGGENDDYGNAITVDELGNIYLAGEFQLTATFGSFSLTSADNNSDLFFSKLDPAGNFIWIKQGSGAQRDAAYSVSYNQDNGIAICGGYSSDFTIGDTTFNSGATEDIFMAVFSTSGNFNTAISIGENGEDAARDVFLTDNNYAYIIGNFSDTIWFGESSLVSHGLADVFITKVNIDEINGIEQQPQNYIHSKYKLSQNQPNPFEKLTVISYELIENTEVNLRVFDINGKEVATLINQKQPPGNYEVEFNAEGLPAGVYYYRLTVGEYSQTKKMVLMK
ncbi:MAG: T9SS type A sorting domain-containing protein [Bacteroidales bacterium]|nr:T9SS type A sorting domain-containing protein [Bacteroidales bacterium]